jgi:hypothetical protein
MRLRFGRRKCGIVAGSTLSWRAIKASPIDDDASHMRQAARFDDGAPRLWWRVKRARASAWIGPVPILVFLAVAGCASAPMPANWTRIDGRVIDPPQLEADKSACRSEMEQAQLVTNARGLVAIQLPGQESPTLKVYTGCMTRRGYAAVR